MILGVLIGTYSSIFVAAPMLKYLSHKTLEKKKKKLFLIRFCAATMVNNIGIDNNVLTLDNHSFFALAFFDLDLLQ